MCINLTHDWNGVLRFGYRNILSGPSWVTRYLRDKASPQGVPGRSTGPGKDTSLVGRCLCQTTRELVTII